MVFKEVIVIYCLSVLKYTRTYTLLKNANFLNLAGSRM